jgi:sugar/nucleoside kinase (ribokinase family)
MDVIGIGLANIDLISHVAESFLAQHKLTKHQAIRLNDLDFARLRAALTAYDIQPGGCAANTMCGLGAAGVPARFYGKIGHDMFESAFRSGFQPYGVAYDVPPSTDDSSQCAVLITPDGERSFAYTRGASWGLHPEDIDWAELTNAHLVYAEIYAMAFGGERALWPVLVNHLRESKVPLALKIVDREYAALYRAALFGLAEEGILTLIIGNTDNLMALAGRDTPMDAAQAFLKWNAAVLMTNGADGASYINGNDIYEHTPARVDNPVNSSGAGDQFAAGFIEGLLKDLPLRDTFELAEKRAKSILMINAPRPLRKV